MPKQSIVLVFTIILFRFDFKSKNYLPSLVFNPIYNPKNIENWKFYCNCKVWYVLPQLQHGYWLFIEYPKQCEHDVSLRL